jgi:stage III sporulation protein SpoIIIAA
MIVDRLKDVLPASTYNLILPHLSDDVIELGLDLNRPIKVHTQEGYRVLNTLCTYADLDYITKNVVVGVFGNDNRAGVTGTLHRISIIKDKLDKTIGATIRFGKDIEANICLYQDLLDEGKSLLILGPPGKGKTTLLRSTAKYLADKKNKRVVVIDTSNEIAGEGVVPHEAVGNARRMMVPLSKTQADVMVEAVKNHTPQVIVIDEISTTNEARSARVIAERGVQMIATAHGNSLKNAINNDTLKILVGGISTVTISDKEMEKRNCSKQVLSRDSMPTFDAIVEIIDFDTVAIHHDIAMSIDYLLDEHGEVLPEIRVLSNYGVEIKQQYVCRYD